MQKLILNILINSSTELNNNINNSVTNEVVDKSLEEILKTDLLWLLILIGILISLGIIATIYKIITYRRTSIISKKIDYLVEDIIYKSEYITPSIEAIVKLSNYVDLVENVIKKKSDSLIKYVTNNKKSVSKISKQLKEMINDKKK